VVERSLGEGGMASIYVVRHAVLGSLHALKVLKETDPRSAERLLREGRAQSALRHPNIASVTDVVTQDGVFGLVMEFVDGPSLADVLDAAVPFGAAQVWALGDAILAGMESAHAADLVHRDLKPSNVLLELSADGVTPKVADFGLVKMDSDGDLSTRSGMMMGTPAFMAPEQIADAKAVGPRADVFSLGAVLYQLVSGRLPFKVSNLLTLVDAIRTGRFERLDPMPLADAPAEWAPLIHQCLEPDPMDRPADAAAVRRAWARVAPPDHRLWAPSLIDQLRNLGPSQSAVAIAATKLTPPSGLGPTQATPAAAPKSAVAEILSMGTLDPEEPSVPLVAPAPSTLPTPPVRRGGMLWLGGAVAIVAVLGAIVASGGGELDGSPAAGPPPEVRPTPTAEGCAGAPRSGGTIRHGIAASRGPTDPYGQQITLDRDVAKANIFEGTGHVTTSNVAPDRMSVRYVVRQGPRFHPHRCLTGDDRVTAKDVAWSLQYVANKARTPIASVEVVSDSEVEVKLGAPLAKGAYTPQAVLLPAALEGCADPRTWNTPVGTGPYRWVHVDDPDLIVLERFDGYWGEPGYADRLEYRNYRTAVLAMTAARKGEVHSAEVGDPRAYLKDPAAELPVLKDPALGEGLTLSSADFKTLVFLTLERRGSSDSTRWTPSLAAAVERALDREAIAQAYSKETQTLPSATFIRPRELGSRVANNRLTPDPSAVGVLLAKAELERAGPLPELVVSSGGTKRREAGQILAANLRAAGLRARWTNDYRTSDMLLIERHTEQASPTDPTARLISTARWTPLQRLDESGYAPIKAAVAKARQARGRAAKSEALVALDAAIRASHRLIVLGIVEPHRYRRHLLVRPELCGLFDPVTKLTIDRQFDGHQHWLASQRTSTP